MDDPNTRLASPPVAERVRPRGSGRLRRALLIAALLLAAAALAWSLRPRETPVARGGRFTGGGPMPIAAATAEQGDVPVTLSALGTVTSLATVTVKTQINGQLVAIEFREGQNVKVGDPLAEIDPRPYQVALAQAQGQLARDQALLGNAEVDLQRYRKLFQQDSIPQQQLATQEALVHQYDGTVKTDQAQVDSAKLNLTYCHIVAPVSGRVGLRQVDQGNYVSVSDANGIVLITQLQPITVVFTLPEDNLPEVMRRLHAGAALEVDAYDRTLTSELAQGRLETVDNQIDTSTGTIKLKAVFENQDETLFPNQFVNIKLVLDVLHGATVIPAAAVQRGAPGTFVYVIKPDDTVEVRPTKLGPAEGDRVAVVSGLTPGDRVVVDGADRLRDGAKVTVPQAEGKSSPPSAGSEPRRGNRRSQQP